MKIVYFQKLLVLLPTTTFWDKLDQLKATTYCIDRESHKWWHRISFSLIDTRAVNAYIIHRNAETAKILIKEFRRVNSTPCSRRIDFENEDSSTVIVSFRKTKKTLSVEINSSDVTKYLPADSHIKTQMRVLQ